ncbi:hypothetical protein QR680_010950 [Steinernema hermaphroditum]|uniref:Uncharacterized protein n=1 Tax=Steinernema hermaphroditum TaxID=289476 RepID=A0AA39MCN2_9BILA|nr:hypothetical protein QR680_010950 [Steinernema hermaphroditum]
MSFLRCLPLVAIICLASSVSADADSSDNIIDEVKKYDVLTLKRSALACPLPIVGKSCPESNAVYYFTCCGGYDRDNNFLPSSECCFRLQDWVVVSMAVLALLSILSCIIGFLKCMCCSR